MKNKRKQIDYDMSKQRQRFSIRKLSIGAASVLLGTTTLLFGSKTYAATESQSQQVTETQQVAEIQTENKTSDVVKMEENDQKQVEAKTEVDKTDSQTAAKSTSEVKDETPKVEKAEKPAENTQFQINKNVAPVNKEALTESKAEADDKISANFSFYDSNGDTIAEGVTISAKKGSTVRDAIKQRLQEDLAAQEGYYGPNGEDYVYDSFTDKKTGVSPVIAQTRADSDTTGSITEDGFEKYPELKAKYDDWLAYKKKNFPLAGYIINEAESVAAEEGLDDELVAGNNYDIMLKDPAANEVGEGNATDKGRARQGYINDWREIHRVVKFRKYHSSADVINDQAKDAADPITDPTSNSTEITKAGTYVQGDSPNQVKKAGKNALYPTDKESQGGLVTTMDEVNSLTSSIPGRPTGKTNKILVKWVGRRYYDSATGKIVGQSSAETGNNAVVVQFPKVAVTQDIEDHSATDDSGVWTTFDSDIPESGTTGAYGADGKNTYAFRTNGVFYKADKIISDPVDEYIIYYHNQPVDITFEDITNGMDKPIELSKFDAKDQLAIRENSKLDPRTTKKSELDELRRPINLWTNKLKTNPDSKLFQGNLSRAQAKLDEYYKIHGNKGYKQYSYQADSNLYQNGKLNQDDTFAKAATNAIQGLKTKNYQNILKAYEDNGYAFVSADADDLDYDKDGVWTSDKKLITKHRVIKLIHVATEVPEQTKTIKRTVHYVTDGDHQELRDPEITTVTYTMPAYYTDSQGKIVKAKKVTIDGKTYLVPDGEATKPSWELKSDDKNFSERDVPEIKDGKLAGDWIRVDASKDKDNGPALKDHVVSGDDLDPATFENGADQEYTVYYAQPAEHHQATKTVKRTVHYVTYDGHKPLKDDTNASVTYTQDYYTNKDGKPVNVKTIVGEDGKEFQVIDRTNTATPKDAPWVADKDNQTFDEVDIPEIKDGKIAGDWTRVDATKDKANGPDLKGEIVSADPSVNKGQDVVNGADQEYTIYYAQPAEHHQATKTVKRTVHYVTYDGHKPSKDDTTASVTYTQDYYTDKEGNFVNAKTIKNKDGQEFLIVDSTNKKEPKDATWVADKDNQTFDEVDIPEIKDGKIAGDWTRVDATKDKANGPDLNGEVVSADPSVNKVEDVVNGADQEYTVYYAQPVETKTITKEAVRTIHYVGDEGKNLDPSEMPELKDVTTQHVTIEGQYYATKDGKPVSVKIVKNSKGKDVLVIDKVLDEPHIDKWTIKDAKGVTEGNNGYNFEPVTDPDEITLSSEEAAKRKVIRGTWFHSDKEDHKDRDNLDKNITTSDWPKDGKLVDGYLVYKLREEWEPTFQDQNPELHIPDDKDNPKHDEHKPTTDGGDPESHVPGDKDNPKHDESKPTTEGNDPELHIPSDKGNPKHVAKKPNTKKHTTSTFNPRSERGNHHKTTNTVPSKRQNVFVPTKNQHISTPKSETMKNNVKNTDSNIPTLPQTGEKQNKALTFGFGILALSALLGLAGYRKRKDN